MSVVADFTFKEKIGDFVATVNADDEFVNENDERRKELSSEWFDLLEQILAKKKNSMEKIT